MVVKEAHPDGCSSGLYPHYHLDITGGDHNVRVPLDRVGVDATKKRLRPTKKMLSQARRLMQDDSMGLCIACGAEACQVEPDARCLPCDSCDERAVYGAEEIVIQWQGV